MHIKTFENFIGQSNQNKKKQRKLLYAKELEKRDKTPDTIRLITGWFRNRNDNEWRFENSSYNLKINDITYTSKKFIYKKYQIDMNLFDLLSNTSLFKDYPILKKVRICLFEKLGDTESNIRGSYDEVINKITIHDVAMTYRQIAETKDTIELYKEYITDEHLATLPHKTRSGKPINKEEKRKEYQELLRQYSDTYYSLLSKPIINLTDTQRGTLVHEIQHAIQSIEGFPSGSNPYLYKPKKYFDEETGDSIELDPFQQYQSEAGEIEAREVQDRIKLNSVEKYIVYDGRYADEEGIGYVTSFATRDEAEHFINANKIVVKDNGEKIGTKYLDIIKKDKYKNIKPLDKNQGIKPEHVNKRYV